MTRKFALALIFKQKATDQAALNETIGVNTGWYISGLSTVLNVIRTISCD